MFSFDFTINLLCQRAICSPMWVFLFLFLIVWVCICVDCTCGSIDLWKNSAQSTENILEMCECLFVCVSVSVRCLRWGTNGKTENSNEPFVSTCIKRWMSGCHLQYARYTRSSCSSYNWVHISSKCTCMLFIDGIFMAAITIALCTNTIFPVRSFDLSFNRLSLSLSLSLAVVSVDLLPFDNFLSHTLI